MNIGLDPDGNVVAKHRTFSTLAKFQEIAPSVTSVVLGAPREVTVKWEHGVHNHRKTSGDGTEIGHYVVVSNLDKLKDLAKARVKAKTEVLLRKNLKAAEDGLLNAIDAVQNEAALAAIVDTRA